jgi:hypothetical protein
MQAIVSTNIIVISSKNATAPMVIEMTIESDRMKLTLRIVGIVVDELILGV